jgi:HSP20 family protein
VAAGPQGGARAPARSPARAFDDLLTPFFDVGAAGGLLARPDRVFDMAERLMDSVLPRGMGMGGGGLLPSLGAGFPRALERDLGRTLERTVGVRRIALDVLERNDAYVVTAEVPGVPKEALRVDVDEDSGLLTIAAEKTVETGGGEPAAAAAAAGGGGDKAEPAAAAASGDKAEVPATAAGAANVLRSERAYGRIERSLSLPDDADWEKISAKLEHGVLSLTIPKHARAEGHGKKKVEIQ